jgi:ubiquinol-cytochrome c reductase iron-sulfur subunit
MTWAIKTTFPSVTTKDPNIAVIVGVCTHLGCSPTYRPELGAADLGGDAWKGGFYCPCHGSKFDLAGRVYTGVPALLSIILSKFVRFKNRCYFMFFWTDTNLNEGV